MCFNHSEGLIFGLSVDGSGTQNIESEISAIKVALLSAAVNSEMPLRKKISLLRKVDFSSIIQLITKR